MARSRSSDTRARIQEVARELFLRQGIQRTSLRDISDRLGITKPALYYHFDSREDLVRSIIQPLIDDTEAFLAAREAGARPGARRLLEDYFDLLIRHQDVVLMMVRELSTLAYLDLGTRVLEWRRRLIALLLGPEPAPAEEVRAVVAIGGMSDCAVAFPGMPVAELRRLAVDAACAVLDG